MSKIIINGVEKPIVAEAIQPVLVYNSDYYEDEAQEIWDGFLSGRPVYFVAYPNSDYDSIYVPVNYVSCTSSSGSDSSSGSGSGSSSDPTRTVLMYFYSAYNDNSATVTLHIIPENNGSDSGSN